MKKNKAFFIPLILILFCAHLSAQWQGDLSSLLEARDYRSAISYLENNSDQIDEMFRPTLLALRCYTYNRLNDKQNEYDSLVEYYEKYRGGGRYLGFLGQWTLAQLSAYLYRWDNRYPLVKEMGLIRTGVYDSSYPPGEITIGLEIENDALYKLSDGEKTLEGGLFKKGYNAVRVESARLFDRSGTHRFFFELKAGDLVLIKEFSLDISVVSALPPKPVERARGSMEYKLSLYLGGRMVASSTRLPADKPDWSMGLKPTPGLKFEPFGPKEDPDPAQNSVSIFQAAALANELVKLFKKDQESDLPAPPIRKYQRIETKFLRWDEEGRERDVEAEIVLKTGYAWRSSI